MSLDEATISALRREWDSGASAKVGGPLNRPPPPSRALQQALSDDDYADMVLRRILERHLPTKDTGARELKLPPQPPVALADGRKSSQSTWLLFLPDIHRPYHSVHAWNLALSIARNMRCRAPGKFRIIQLGDYIDAYAVSSHAKDPNRTRKFEEEIADANHGLDELDAVRADEYDIVLGNHCWRLARYLAERAPELYNMVTVEELLRFAKRGWRVTKYQETLRVGKLNITHDLGKAGATAHEDARRAYEGNAIIGHTHRSAISYQGNMSGIPHAAAMFGWLGDPKLIDYKHQAKALREWVHGVGVGLMEPDGVVHMAPVPFINGRACIFGEVVS